jgi:hypothetical protein
MTRNASSPKDVADVLGAYRADQGKRGNEPFGRDDGAWVQLGLTLSHAVALPARARPAHLRAASAIARELLGDRRWKAGYRTDPEPPANDLTLSGRIRSIAEELEDAGALTLSDAILSAFVAADGSAAPIELGRVEAVRGRLAWKSGDVERAAERLRRVAAAARRLRSAELHVRELIGRVALARLAGNYPRARLLAMRAIRAAEGASLTRLAGIAHHAMMVGAGVGAAFEDSVIHGWQAYVLAGGDDRAESEVLGNVGQLFLVEGHAETALAAFRAVVARHPPERLLLPALGGMAIAAARLRDRAVVEESERAITRRADQGAPPYEAAAALLELYQARVLVGDVEIAEGHRARTLEIAAKHRYHEIVHHALQPFDAGAPTVRSLPPRVEMVATAVRMLTRV